MIATPIKPNAAKPPIDNPIRKKEKSALLINTVAVKPQKTNVVTKPADRIDPGNLAAAIANIGTKMSVSATTYNDNPKYCIEAEVSLLAHFSATQLTAMNATRTINQL